MRLKKTFNNKNFQISAKQEITLNVFPYNSHHWSFCPKVKNFSRTKLNHCWSMPNDRQLFQGQLDKLHKLSLNSAHQTGDFATPRSYSLKNSETNRGLPQA